MSQFLKSICTLVVDQLLKLVAAAKNVIYVELGLLTYKLSVLDSCLVQLINKDVLKALSKFGVTFKITFDNRGAECFNQLLFNL